MKIPLHFLEHRATFRPIADVQPSVGRKFDADVLKVECLIVDKRSLVVDQRPHSETLGAQIMSTSQIVARKERWMRPESEIILWQGQPMERTATVVAVGYNTHSRAPESAQFWLV